MAMERRVMIMYLIAVWCCADTLVVRALLPSSVTRHAKPAISSGDDPLMGAVQVVPLPGHHHHRNSPTAPRMKDGDDERWEAEERRKQGESKRGNSSGGGGHDSVVIDVGESEGTGSADVAAEYARRLDEMRAEALRAGVVSTQSSGNGCGHRFHTDTACIQNLELCPLRRCSGTLAPILPDSPPAPVLLAGPHATVLPDHSPSAPVFPDGPHAPMLPDGTHATYFQCLCCRLTWRGFSLFQLMAGSVGVVLWIIGVAILIKTLVEWLL